MQNLSLRTEALKKTPFLCSICNQWHDDLPLSYSVKVPYGVAGIAEQELKRRVVFTVDQCIVDDRDFYLRGRIPIPIIGTDKSFIWGVWARIDQKDFIRTNDSWSVEGREVEPSYAGWLNTELPIYGHTLHMDLLVHTQPVGRRPHFEVVDAKHTLGKEQRQGISMERVREIAERTIHPATT